MFSHTTGMQPDGAGQAMADGNKQNHEPCDLNNPAHQNPGSQLCVRKMFSASFVPQQVENHTYCCFVSVGKG